ncbi:MAG: phosphoribosylamine--glycine ligase [Myxococcales bacterium]|nr:phosphoribosylamine--glycine ligase [Polyangiaceae bacterium]MDW8250606.1 phosphoribosylamine--glycine ligase [Myxococcales bacterium]
MTASNLRVLVIGSGAREHALGTKLATSERVAEVIVAPGNGGTRRELGWAPLANADDPTAVAALARELEVDLVIFGPEAPLVRGAADAVRNAGILAFGPGAAGARLEGSKAFFKEFAVRHGLPTAPFRVFTEAGEAHRYIEERGGPLVVKADGLCAGKGVVVAATPDEAHEAVAQMMERRFFGEAGSTVVIEDVLEGAEASVHVITDGRGYLVLPPVQDHKRLLDGDRGPNTGGMGAYGPASLLDERGMARVVQRVVEPTLLGLHREGIPYRGVLFFGLMVTPGGDPMILEINARFGDPETGVLVALLDEDLAELLHQAASGSLERVGEARVHGHAAAVVLASEGYPFSPRKGQAIVGLEEASEVELTYVLHAGTEEQAGALVTAGGRVLCVTSQGDTLKEAVVRAYEACARIRFAGMQFRRDIGYRALGGAGVGVAPRQGLS